MTAADMRLILLKLAHRLILASWKPSEAHPDRLHLYTTILQQLGLYKDARELLETEPGRFLCSRNLACDHLRRDIMKAGGWQKEEAEVAEQRILEKRSGMLLYNGYLCHFKVHTETVTGLSLSLSWMQHFYHQRFLMVRTTSPACLCRLPSRNIKKRRGSYLQKLQRKTAVMIGQAGWA